MNRKLRVHCKWTNADGQHGTFCVSIDDPLCKIIDPYQTKIEIEGVGCGMASEFATEPIAGGVATIDFRALGVLPNALTLFKELLTIAMELNGEPPL